MNYKFISYEFEFLYIMIVNWSAWTWNERWIHRYEFYHMISQYDSWPWFEFMSWIHIFSAGSRCCFGHLPLHFGLGNLMGWCMISYLTLYFINIETMSCIISSSWLCTSYMISNIYSLFCDFIIWGLIYWFYICDIISTMISQTMIS